jgi:rod shape-determining protein MreC
MNKKRLIILAILFFVSFSLIVYQYKNISATRQLPLRNILLNPLDFLNSLSNSLKSDLKNFINTYEENKRLKEQLNNVMVEKQNYYEIIQENERLKAILSLKKREPKYFTTAKAIAKGYDRLLQTIIIDKGRNDGLKKDMAVITPKGLVGKIYSTRDNFSEVLLLKDPNFSVAVRLQNSRTEGILSGTGYSYGILKYIAPEEDVKVGENVITSGTDGIFPPGLPVGVVSSVKKEGIEFFLDIKIRFLQEDTKIEEVIILSP